jgi:hypothetical protein
MTWFSCFIQAVNLTEVEKSPSRMSDVGFRDLSIPLRSTRDDRIWPFHPSAESAGYSHFIGK